MKDPQPERNACATAQFHRNHHEEHHEKNNIYDAPATVRVHGTAIGAIGIGSGGRGANSSINKGATKHLEPKCEHSMAHGLATHCG